MFRILVVFALRDRRLKLAHIRSAVAVFMLLLYICRAGKRNNPASLEEEITITFQANHLLENKHNERRRLLSRLENARRDALYLLLPTLQEETNGDYLLQESSGQANKANACECMSSCRVGMLECPSSPSFVVVIVFRFILLVVHYSWKCFNKITTSSK